jgi:hypothetical protein
MTEVVRNSETSVYFYEITQSHITEGFHLHPLYFMTVHKLGLTTEDYKNSTSLAERNGTVIILL